MVLNRLLGFDVHDDWRHQLLNGLASSWDHCRCRIRCVLLYAIPGQPHRIADPRFLLFDPVLLGDHPATGVSTSSTIRAPHLRETLVFFSFSLFVSMLMLRRALSQNLTCLYSYNRREEDVEAFTVGWQRMLSIIIGTCWAGVVSNVIWPYAARKELRLGLSEWVT